MTRVWTRRSAPTRRRSAGTFTSRRRRSFPLRVMASRQPLAHISGALKHRLRSLDLERAHLHAIDAVLRSRRHLEALALAARPEAEVDRVDARGRRRERHLRVRVIAEVL